MFKLYKYYLLIVLLLSSTLYVMGFSSFTENYNEVTFQDSSIEVPVTIKYFEITKSWVPVSDSQEEVTDTITLPKDSDEANNMANQYSKGDTWGHQSGIIIGDSMYDTYYKCTISQTRITFIVTVREANFSYDLIQKKTAERRSVSTQTDEANFYVKKGSLLDFSSLNKDYYYFTEETFLNPYNFSTSVENQLTLYAVKDSNDSALTNLEDKIDSNISILNVFDPSLGGMSQTSGENYSATNDKSYVGNCLYLNSSTIPNTMTVNLLTSEGTIGNNNEGSLGAQEDYSNAHQTSDGYLSLSLGGNKNNLNLVLNGDLTVNGVLNIGAKTGNNGSSSKISYINGGYTSIDLHGFNLIVNGVVNAYGEIKDSVGGGQIIVNNGGTLLGLMSISDLGGGNQTIWGYGKGSTPFSDYRFPYITAQIKFNYNSNFNAFTKIYLGRLGGSSIVFKLLGNGGYVSWNSQDENDFIIVTPYKLSNLSSSTYTNDLFNYRYDIKIFANLKFNDIGNDVTVTPGSIGGNDISGTVSIELSRVNFPISCLFDISLLGGSNIEIPYIAMFYPGSSLYVDETSSITFSYLNNRTFDRKSVATKHIEGYTDDLAGGIVSMIRSESYYNSATVIKKNVGIYAVSNYYNYVNSANIVIDGDINFNSGNEGKFILSGKMVLCQKLIEKIISNKNILQTYYLVNHQSGGSWFDSVSQALNPTNDGISYTSICSYQVLPLIVNNKGYALSSDNNIIGNFIEGSDLIENNGEYYFLKSSDYIYGSDNNSEDSQIDKTLSVIKATNADLDRMIVYDGSSFYVYYAGVYVKAAGITIDSSNFITSSVTINFGKFFSSSSHASITNGTYDAFVIEYNSNIDMWKNVSGFSVTS